jgi:regulator of sigma E protease
VGVVQTIGETYEESRSDGAFYVWLNLLQISVLLSANLGVMNLLPLPALDGGRILLFLVEALRRKRLNQNVEGYINLAGFSLLMALMVLIMLNDVRKLF